VFAARCSGIRDVEAEALMRSYAVRCRRHELVAVESVLRRCPDLVAPEPTIERAGSG